MTSNQFDRQILSSIIGGALLAFGPFLLTGPTWRILDQPLVLAGEILILLLAIGVPMFVPNKYREAIFGPRMYLLWVGVGLVLSAIYLLAQPRELATCVGLFVLLAGAWSLWRGVNLLRRS